MNDAAGAYRLMVAALEHDSTFAMAAHYISRAARGLGREAEADRALEIAEHLANRATDRERLLILAEAAGRRAPITEYVRVARELTDRYPDDADGQMILGHAQFTAGDWWASVAAYRRAVEIDSAAGVIRGTFCRACTALIAMSHSYMWADSAAAAERAGRRLIVMFPDEGLAWGSLVEPLLRQNRWADAETAMARAAGLSLTKGEFDPSLDRGLIRSGRFAQLDLKLWSRMTSSPERRGEASWLLGISLRNQGRLREATALAERGVVPGTPIRIPGPPDPTSVAIAAFDAGQPRESARIFLSRADAIRAGTDPPGLKARVLSWNLTLAATALAAAGDTAMVRALADSVERIGALSRFGRDGRLHYFLRGLLFQRQGRHADAVDAFRRSLFSLTDGYTRTNLEMARSLMALRRHAEAIAILQPALRGGIDGSNAYVSHTELHEALAQAFEQAGRSDSATVHYAAVEAAWRGADPMLHERYRWAQSKAGAKIGSALRKH
jgi:tetratricopeptide (TPR) repeat protein